MVQKQTEKRVIITGALGQDGANMSEYLLNNTDHKVYGMMRRSATPNFLNIEDFKDNSKFELIYGDLTDEISIDRLVQKIKPDYFINFGANSFVGCSWDMPLQVFDTNALGVLRCLEAIRKFQPSCRFYSAGSSEEFGDVDYSPQDMKHPIKPRSPYGASKAAARHLVKVYRESYGLYAIHGILFNHEGTKRGEEFVTRKITKGVARIYLELRDVNRWRIRGRGKPNFTPIELGNLDAKRDWSDSEDFVEGVWLMLNQDEYIEKTEKFSKDFKERWEMFENHGCALGGSDIDLFAEEIVLENVQDYLLASGETHSIREFVERAFYHAGLRDSEWVGEGVDEKFVHQSNGYKVDFVTVNPDFYRPAEVEVLMGDPSDAKKIGWNPKNSFDNLVKKMVDYDISYASKHSS